MTYEIKHILAENDQKYHSDPYIYEKVDGEWQSKTYGDFVRDVKNFAGFLQFSKLNDCKIVIYAANSYNYLVADAAIMGYVGTSVTISKEWTLHDLQNAQKKFEFDAIIYDDERAENVKQLVEFFPELMAIHISSATKLSDFTLDENRINENMISKIVFSSGTTGTPKAVTLSQHNMFSNFDLLNQRAPMGHDDIDYLFLPLSHTYASISNFLSTLITGMKLYLCSDTQKIAEELQEVRPTIFCAVPLIFERLYNICQEKQLDPKELLGGNVRHLFAGGAHLKTEIIQFFKEHQTGLLNTYGLSETSAIVAVEYHNTEDFESDGTIFENQEVKIDQPDEHGVGEIIVRGENITKGYYLDDRLNREAFDDNGFFHTGDLGRILNQKLYIKGRKKRIILLSNGENVSPDDIEMLFREFPQINKAKVFEKDQKVFASIYCDKIIDLEPIVDHINDQLPKYARIREYELVLDNIEKRIK